MSTRGGRARRKKKAEVAPTAVKSEREIQDKKLVLIALGTVILSGAVLVGHLLIMAYISIECQKDMLSMGCWLITVGN